MGHSAHSLRTNLCLLGGQGQLCPPARLVGLPVVGDGEHQEGSGGVSEGLALEAPEILVGSAGRLANGGAHLLCLSHSGFGHLSVSCVLGSLLSALHNTPGPEEPHVLR